VQRRNSTLAPLFLLIAGSLATSSCIKRGYPLGQGGNVDIRPDVEGALFAADSLDSKGRPIGARQDPHQTGVTLSMVEGGQAAFGAFVDVRVVPSQALTLLSDPAEKSTPTCSFNNGSFRCIASQQGLARFIASSQSDWSGNAKLVVSWADQNKEQAIPIFPAGLPQNATNFSLIIGGLDGADRVIATFQALECTLGPLPDNLGSKWRDGQIRARQAYVRATPPANSPSVVENAPVIVESLSAEAALSLNQDCAERDTRLRVTLDSTGQSSPFFLCFSDIGGQVAINVTSGEKVIDPTPQLFVDPEPRLLRARVLTSLVPAGAAVDLFEVSAYSADRVRISMPVDLKVGNDQILVLSAASTTLASEIDPATVIQVTPLTPGTTELHVSPRLLTMPDCKSDSVTVVPLGP